MKDIDFTTLTLQDALDFAVLIEREAAVRYDELADQLTLHHTAEAAEFFRSMVINETKHAQELAARRKELFGLVASRVDESMIYEVEAPEYDTVRAFMTVQDALKVALEAEEKAAAFFTRALAGLQNAEVRALFEELLGEEFEHQQLVRNEMAKHPAVGVNVSEYADEPVGQ